MQEDPVLNAPVKSLQLMLRTIASAAGEPVTVIPDGIYGESTTQAVSAFQSQHGLPVTGIVDPQTFQAIVDAYDLAVEHLQVSQGPVLLFPAHLTVTPGQYHPHVSLVQAMLQAPGQEFPSLQPHETLGHLDAATVENLRLLQRHASLPETGCLDKRTWNRVNRLYRALFDRESPPSQG